jgi:hypothetical protein
MDLPTPAYRRELSFIKVSSDQVVLGGAGASTIAGKADRSL